MQNNELDRVLLALTKVPIYLKGTEDKNIQMMELQLIDMKWDVLIEKANKFLRWEEIKIGNTKSEWKKAEQIIELSFWIELPERPVARITRSWGLYLKKA